MLKKLETVNPRICKFYSENPGINFDAINLICIDLMENMMTDMNTTLNNTIQSQILTTITDINNNIVSLKDSVNSITSTLIVKFVDIKRDYVEDVKNILSSTAFDKSDKIMAQIDKNLEMVLLKTTNAINEVVPKSQEHYYSQLDATLQNFKHAMRNDFERLTKSPDTEGLPRFIEEFETKCTKMFQSIQTPLYSYISESEKRLEQQISDVKRNTDNNSTLQTNISQQLSDHLNRYNNNSSDRGRIGEAELECLLNSMYTSAEITNVSGVASNADLIMVRANKPTILFENKEYTQNVNKDEVAKFVKDCTLQKQNGIMLSSKSGIVGRDNYQIEINGASVLVYVHNAEYNATKVRIAIDIIDCLAPKLLSLTREDDTITISKETMDEINREIATFITAKTQLIKTLDEQHKTSVKLVQGLKMPAIDTFLASHFASVVSTSHTCKYCTFSSTSARGLTTHYNTCKENPNNAQKFEISQPVAQNETSTVADWPSSESTTLNVSSNVNDITNLDSLEPMLLPTVKAKQTRAKKTK